MFGAGVVFFPLLGALIAGLFGRWVGDRGAQLVTCGGLILSALCSWVVLVGVLSGEPYKIELFRWIHAGTFEADFQAGNTYAVLCFIQDRSGGAPHAIQNDMYSVFALEE